MPTIYTTSGQVDAREVDQVRKSIELGSGFDPARDARSDAMTSSSSPSRAPAGWGAVAVLGALGGWVACVAQTGMPVGDGGAEGALAAGKSAGRTIDASAPPLPATPCGDASCPEPSQIDPLDVRACCLPSGACGLRARRLGSECLSRAEVGTVDLACPTLHLGGGIDAQGCCSPDGRCGHFDRFGELGCVASPTSDGSVACTYARSLDCRAVVELPCDGPEDCGAGRVCCGRSALGVYDAFGCFESCDAQSKGFQGVWLEICHPGGVCADSRYSCASAVGLPGFLGRCYRPADLTGAGAKGDAGDAAPRGVACGAAPCAANEKCCVRSPGQPYCAPLSTPCTCADERDR
jgi:hypothetical protein